MWKFDEFSVTQILREINFEESISSKIALFANLEALKMINLVNFSLQKSVKINKNYALKKQIRQVWFHAKSEWQINAVISTLWNPNFREIEIKSRLWQHFMSQKFREIDF